MSRAVNQHVEEIERAYADRESLLKREHQARVELEEALILQRTLDERLALLVEASGVLLGSLSIESVQPAILDISQRLITADAYAIWRIDPNSSSWKLVASAGMHSDYTREPIPALEGAREPLERPLVIEDVTQSPMLSTRQSIYQAEGIKALLVMPLSIHSRIAGTLTFYFRRPHRFSNLEIRIATALANLAGSALSSAAMYEEQSRLRAEAEAAEKRAHYLAEASKVLTSSLDYEFTLTRLAQLLVPGLADWCAIDVLDENRSISRLAVAHVDPAKVEWARTLQDRYPPDPESSGGVPNVIRTGKSEFYSVITDEMLVGAAVDEEHLRLMREVGLTSVMLVPLSIPGQIFGVISLVFAESHRRYVSSDLAFAEDLARRAASAIHNALLYREAQHANRVKDEFLATLSHELRTPLTAILGWSRMLRSGDLDQNTSARALEVIERNAQLQAQLIEDVLDVSRIITGKLKLNVGHIDLVQVIEAAIDSVRLAAQAKEIRIQTSLDTSGELIFGDAARLQQVVWNLIWNAVKFTLAGGRVTVRLEQRNSGSTISVSDTGQGISKDFLPYVFDRFRQADSSTTRKHGGLGLGLAIVRHLVELHGGSVAVESRGAGIGTTFIIRLPPAPKTETPQVVESEAVPDETATLGSNGRLIGVRVLGVDDEADAREFLNIALTKAGAVVSSAASAAEAYEKFALETPDIILSDVGMPYEDGYKLIKRIRDREARAQSSGGSRSEPVTAIALSAYARAEDSDNSLQAGFQAHISKPIAPAELIEAIASAIAKNPD